MPSIGARILIIIIVMFEHYNLLLVPGWHGQHVDLSILAYQRGVLWNGNV